MTAEAAMKEAARAVAERAVAEAGKVAAEAELARVLGAAEAPLTTAAAATGLNGVVLGIVAAVTCWYFGLPVPIP